jgi:hypothetical protein
MLKEEMYQLKVEVEGSAYGTSFCRLSTAAMEHSPFWQANCHSANQEIPHLLWKPKVNDHVHKSLPLVSVLNHINPAYTLLPYFFNIHFNIALQSIWHTCTTSLSWVFGSMAFTILPTWRKASRHCFLTPPSTNCMVPGTKAIWPATYIMSPT